MLLKNLKHDAAVKFSWLACRTIIATFPSVQVLFTRFLSIVC